MAWCPCDSGLLLSCGKDNRTLCWDTVSGEVLYELPAGTNWNFDLQWSPGARGLLSTSSFDGTVSIYNIEVRGGAVVSPAPVPAAGTQRLGWLGWGAAVVR